VSGLHESEPSLLIRSVNNGELAETRSLPGTHRGPLALIDLYYVRAAGERVILITAGPLGNILCIIRRGTTASAPQCRRTTAKFVSLARKLISMKSRPCFPGPAARNLNPRARTQVIHEAKRAEELGHALILLVKH